MWLVWAQHTHSVSLARLWARIQYLSHRFVICFDSYFLKFIGRLPVSSIAVLLLLLRWCLLGYCILFVFSRVLLLETKLTRAKWAKGYNVCTADRSVGRRFGQTKGYYGDDGTAGIHYHDDDVLMLTRLTNVSIVPAGSQRGAVCFISSGLGRVGWMDGDGLSIDGWINKWIV